MARIKALPVPPRPVPDDDDDEPDCPRCPPVGAPAWMATFADIATLLMAFFVLILSFANFDEVSFKKMTGALREHFGSNIVEILPNPESTTVLELDFRPASTPPAPQDSPETDEFPNAAPEVPNPDPAMERLAEVLAYALESGAMTVSGEGGLVTLRLPEGAAGADLTRALADAASDLAQAASDQQRAAAPEPMPAPADAATPDGAGTAPGDGGADATRRAAIAEARLKVALREVIGEGLVDVQQQQDKVVVTVGAGGAFASGSADLTDDARAIMARIALSAASGAERIIVTGHTDSVPLTGGAFVDNWGLAAARASAVVRELGAQGTLDHARLSAVSRGESAPVADNTTDTGREANRRIEILFDFAVADSGR